MLYLAPSGIHGVGVFTSEPIRKGVKAPLFVRGDFRFTARPVGIQNRYCVETGRPGGGFWRPENFHRMSIGYYLNHSADPNILSRHWVAARGIEAGDELTIDYDLLIPVKETPSGKRLQP